MFRSLPLLLIAGFAFAAEPVAETIEYASTADGTKPLKADVRFVADGKPKPLVAVMHGYSGNRTTVKADVEAFAARGAFAIAPDMRGVGGSAGKPDSGGLDVHDILDAVLAAVAKYPKEIDARNLNVVGYSGGGGNAISCSVRFPDLFRTNVSFFGISDYAGWHKSKGRPDCNARMEKLLGGTPDELPELFLARNAIPAAGNPRGKLHFFWDEQEKQCPPDMVAAFVADYEKATGQKAVVHVSKATDELRWHHGSRTKYDALAKADDLFWADIAAVDPKSPRLPKKGTLVVPGYLVTRSFQVWVEDGTKGRVVVEYDLTGETPQVAVTQNPGKWKVRIETKSPLAALP